MKSSRVSVVVVNDSTAAAVAAPSGRWCSQFTEELQFDIFLKRILLSSAVKIVKSAKEELLRLLLRRVCVLWQKTTTTCRRRRRKLPRVVVVGRRWISICSVGERGLIRGITKAATGVGGSC